MQNWQTKKVAIVCDWIKDWGGAEIVLEQLLEIFPYADIFTSVFWQNNNTLFKNRKIVTSALQYIPFFNRSHKVALMFRPLAFESFDLSEYDIVISSSSAESKGVITKPDCVHICYCHTPTRYFWSHYHEYLNMMEFGVFNFLGKYIAPRMIHRLRQWDVIASKRPDYFIANSINTQKRIQKYYRRESRVIYPGLDLGQIPFSTEKEDYYFYAGRVIPYKKFDLIVDAFNKNKKKIKIVANTKNALYHELLKKSQANIEWIYETDNHRINQIHSKAKAFIFPAEEDFGLVPIAAMATGTPVIAYGKAGALETVKENQTGIFFPEQTIDSLNKAIDDFEQSSFDPVKIRKHALGFDKKVFQKNMIDFIEGIS